MSTAPKKPRETGVWVLTIEHDWGSRGNRRETEYFFRTKPNPDKLKELTGSSHYSLVRKQCSKGYSTTSYH